MKNVVVKGGVIMILMIWILNEKINIVILF